MFAGFLPFAGVFARAAALGWRSFRAEKPHVRVLIVDDDPLFRLAVAAALSADERLEFEVAEAGDGQQCLDAVASTRPDVVVLDLTMPVLDGINAAERIEHEWPEVRVVMLTSSDASADRTRAERAGVEAFLQKASIVEGELAPLLTVDGKAVIGENLQWFAGGHDATIDVGWVPMRKPQFDVSHPLSVLLGSVRSPAVAARVVYADGSSARFDLATPTTSVGHGIHGWFVYEMTDDRRARHPLRFEALDGAGKVIGISAVPKGA